MNSLNSQLAPLSADEYYFLSPYTPGDPIPVAQMVEDNSTDAWKAWQDASAAMEVKTVPMPLYEHELNNG
ncbi:MAG: hypothetical protein NTU86_11250 [Burkholderiales bacterium]|nr:hypothetical protein [Burkholderiales bacterium]